MAPPRNYYKLVVALSFALFLIPRSSAGWEIEGSRRSYYSNNAKHEEMLVGSRPPGCANKCMNCRPCEATLVIPPHRTTISSHRQDDITNYYLLSWKCRCGNKLYHP